MKLYEIDRSIQEILDNMSVDAETGEVTLDEEGLAELTLAREKKLEGVALAVKNMSAEAEAIRNEEKALAERRRVLENKTERMKAFLLDALKGEKLETARVKVSQRKGPATCVVDSSWSIWWWDVDMMNAAERGEITKDARKRILDLLKLEQPEPKVSKAGLKQLLAEGYEIPGCHMEDGKPSLRIQ